MRIIIKTLEGSFEELYRSSLAFVQRINIETETRGSAAESPPVLLVRSSAVVEQCFGGIRTRLWDDPFEWTLPEALKNRESIVEYLNEVKATRVSGFEMLQSDSDLLKEIPAPLEIRSLFEVINRALLSSNSFYWRAFQAEEQRLKSIST